MLLEYLERGKLLPMLKTRYPKAQAATDFERWVTANGSYVVPHELVRDHSLCIIPLMSAWIRKGRQ